MKKKYVIICCIVLLVWFFLDMIGLNFGNQYLVSQSFSDDGIFFIIYVTSLLLFAFKEKIGKYILNIWLFLWLLTQFFSHWYFTIIGQGLNKIEYFKGSIKLIESTTKYIPDLYHIILHILIIVAFVSLNIYLLKKHKH